MSDREEPRYVRFGAVRRSRDLNTGELLAGTSVYPGRLVGPDLFRIDLSEIDPSQGYGYLVVLAACDRPAYFVAGEEVGTGPDGEPLLKIEDAWPVPRSTSITSIQGQTQGALGMWSRGPRDSSTTDKVLRKRLKAGTEWTGTTDGVRFDPALLITAVVNPKGVRRKGERIGRDPEERREKNRARKAYRRQKKRGGVRIPEVMAGPPPEAPEPAASRLVDAVFSRSSNARSPLHGPRHWRGVARNGLALLEETPEADPLVVFLFSLFHDSMRLNDRRDPGHGARAADLARELRGDLYALDDARADLLEAALVEHDGGFASEDPTVGVCWDADRLDLWRIGIRPDPALLSTEAARKPERIRRAREATRVAPPRWKDLARDFGLPWVSV